MARQRSEGASAKPITAALNASKKKTSQSTIGAPAQHNQSSRKGKKAWRKNVDIEPVEEGLESIRAEERVTGKALHKTQDSDLFQIDTKGDEGVRKALPRFSSSQLTSAKILAQRSAVPAVFSRTTSSQKRKVYVTPEEKTRLLRLGKRLRKGPLNSYADPTEFAAGSASLDPSEAVLQSGKYDIWMEQEEEEVRDGLETVRKQPVKAPQHHQPRDDIELPAIIEPHQGTSYNPLAAAHQELLLKANEVEEQREKEAQKLAEAKAKMERAKEDYEPTQPGIPAGMIIDKIDDSEEEVSGDAVEDLIPSKKAPARKTKQQRRKAEKLLAEKRALAEKAARRRMLASVGSVKALRKVDKETDEARQEALAARRAVMREKLKMGLSGQKLGKHKVPERNVEVQLGEDLSESLRALKPEGNLFQDRFLSLQHRGLVEPRVPVLPTKRKTKMKEYEKHAWKKFV